MVTKSKSPEITKIVNNAVNSGKWHIEAGKGHGKLRHESGRMVAFGATVSDRRAWKNLERDIKHIEMGMPGRGESKMITAPIALKRNRHEARC